MYESIRDLPFVCQLNLPEAALHVYREAFNRAWLAGAELNGERYRGAQNHAWEMVRQRFERERETGRWVPRAASLDTHTRTSRREAANGALDVRVGEQI